MSSKKTDRVCAECGISEKKLKDNGILYEHTVYGETFLLCHKHTGEMYARWDKSEKEDRCSQ